MSCSCRCHPLCVRLCCRDRIAFQSRFAAWMACRLSQSLLSRLRRRRRATCFHASLASPPAGACWACCRNCRSCRLSWNLLCVDPGTVMALEMASRTWWGSSPCGTGTLRSCGPHVLRTAPPPPRCAAMGICTASWSEEARSLQCMTWPFAAVTPLVRM